MLKLVKTIMCIKTPSELCAAAENSWRGFLVLLFGEKAFRTDVAVFVTATAVTFAIPGLEWCERALMIYVAFMPLVAEIVNTAIEKTVDRISLERHPLSGFIKDIGSFLVVAAFLGAGICWAVILLGWGLRKVI